VHCVLPKISKIETVIRFEINTFVLVNDNQEQRPALSSFGFLLL
jgi:hypothetical protein